MEVEKNWTLFDKCLHFLEFFTKDYLLFDLTAFKEAWLKFYLVDPRYVCTQTLKICFLKTHKRDSRYIFNFIRISWADLIENSLVVFECCAFMAKSSHLLPIFLKVLFILIFKDFKVRIIILSKIFEEI